MSNDDALLQLDDGDIHRAKTTKALLECDIETPVCRYAERKHGMKAEKFTSPGRRSVPDRLFSCIGGGVFFIEFKRPGKTATPKQEKDHQRRRDMGFRVFVCDDIDQGKRIVDDMAVAL
ncbi:MAG: VRR-NUC domain-containing protein [Acidimicrobiia bacterium]|nr:VRR-NUC domain-containing protein [Acidimicrobiia bacterium]